MPERDDSWTGNYFTYFTEVEEHFQRVRGTGLFLISPLDWALLESWKNAGVPLTAVLRGIDAAFEKWRGRKSKTQMVNSLAFCAQAVLREVRAAHLLPALLLARVDGKSPVEYLAEPQREFVRNCATMLIGKPPARLDDIVEFWNAKITSQSVHSERPQAG